MRRPKPGCAGGRVFFSFYMPPAAGAQPRACVPDSGPRPGEMREFGPSRASPFGNFASSSASCGIAPLDPSIGLRENIETVCRAGLIKPESGGRKSVCTSRPCLPPFIRFAGILFRAKAGNGIRRSTPGRCLSLRWLSTSSRQATVKKFRYFAGLAPSGEDLAPSKNRFDFVAKSP